MGPKGYVQMEEQLPVKAAAAFPSVAGQTADGKLTLTTENNLKTVQGTGFEVKFDDATGTIYSLTYNGKPVFAEGNGPKLDAFRAMTDNDNWAYRQWFAKGLHNLRHKAVDAAAYTRADGAVVLAYTVESQAPYGSNIRDLGISSGRYNITRVRNSVRTTSSLLPVRFGRSIRTVPSNWRPALARTSQV